MEVRKDTRFRCWQFDNLTANTMTGSNVDVEKLLEYEVEYGRGGKTALRPRFAKVVDGVVQVRSLRRV